MVGAPGASMTAGAQPIAVMHCTVIFLHGDLRGAGRSTMSMQSMLAIDACNDPVLIGAATIAIAVDWPSKPPNAASNRQI